MRNRFESFAICIVELYRCMQKIKDIEMKKLGLKANHAMCLYYLGKHQKGLTATELTDLCREDKAAISRTLSQLHDKGFVSCDVSDNKRSYRTSNYLTDKGKELVEKMKERIESAVFNGGDGLDDNARNNFYDSMELILSNLTKYIRENEVAL